MSGHRVGDPGHSARSPDDTSEDNQNGPRVADGDDPSDRSETDRSHDDAVAERIAALQDAWRRESADLANFRKRFDSELERGRTVERERVLSEWLSVMDDLERAIAHARAAPDSVISGLEAILQRGSDILNRLGYRRFDDTDVPFDPNRHDAIATVPADEQHPPGTVVSVEQPGYGDEDRMLRPAGVVVTRSGD